MPSPLLRSTVIAVTLLVTPLAQAGVYSNELAKCLVESTTQQDRLSLVKWLFTSAASHPAVRPIISVDAAQVDQGNRETAALFMRLLTDSCRQESEKALKYEGQVTIQTSFRVLGEVAGQELFTSPEVAQSMSGINQYLDKKALQSLQIIE